MNNNIILAVDDLHTCFKVGKNDLTVVNGVSFDVERGKTLGIVGESGCGKSVTAHSILQLLAKLGRVYQGKVTYRTEAGEELVISSYKKNGKDMRAIRGQEISMIFQDPMMCLNPVYNIGDQIIEGLLEHNKIGKKEALVKAAEMLTTLGIPKATDRLKDYPHQFSGGMKQRVMIAIAMINNPKLLIADEPTTALDVTIQAQILELMENVQKTLGTTIILITHNMGIVADMADNIAVMYMGRIMEFGTAEQIFLSPAHPYTQALLKSVPVLGIGERKRLEPIRGNTPDPADLPEGCEFSPRCDFVTEQCKVAPPDTLVGEGHRVRCWNCKAGWCANEK